MIERIIEIETKQVKDRGKLDENRDSDRNKNENNIKHSSRVAILLIIIS